MQRKMINHIAKGKRVFIGLEDSKKSWKINVRCEGMEIHRATMEAKYSTLRQYLQNKYPECEISVIYEAGFKGFGLYRMLTEDGYQCVVIPPNKVTQEKNNKVKTDKIDARRLAVVLENGDYKACSVPDLQREQDRQYSRTMVQIQKDLTRYKNYIMKLFDFHGYAEFFGQSNGRNNSILRHGQWSCPRHSGILLIIISVSLIHLRNNGSIYTSNLCCWQGKNGIKMP